MKSIYQTKPRTDTRTPSPVERVGERCDSWDFVWEEFIEKCKLYECEEPVFKYLLLCRAYFNAPLPDYIYEAYKHTFTDYDRDLFYKHLTGYDFAADRENSAVPVHFRNIKHIKNPLLAPPAPEGGARMWEVVFPGKAFMIEKYNINGKWLMINGKFWWLWYGYRWAMGLRGLWLVITGTSTSSVTWRNNGKRSSYNTSSSS